MKVAQEIDVDNVTIIINPQNKLEAKIPPSTPSEVVIEEVTGITNFSDSMGTYADAPFSINKGGQQYPITKVGRIVGTNWLVFQTDAPLVADEPDTPSQPEPEQPPNSSIKTYLDYSCRVAIATGTHYELSYPIVVQVTTSDTGGKTPQTVKFDVTLGSQSRTYSYPYSSGNTYYWNSIGDFNYEGQTSYHFGNARVEFTDGSVSLPPATNNTGCMMASLPD